MSDSNGPVRRRRIAGESGPAAPAAKPAARKPVVKKPVARGPKAEPVVPVTKKAAKPARASMAKPTAKTPAAKAPSAKAPVAVPTRAPATKSAAPIADEPGWSGPSRRDVLWLVPATLVAIAALVAGVFLVVNPPGSGNDGDALAASRRQASAAAASAAETIFTFRYDQLDEHLTASKALMTPAFSKEFDKIAPALTELAPQREIVVQAVTRESAAIPCGSECSATKADVLVFVDQARLVGDSKEPTVFANRIKVSMTKSDDGWLVSNIRAL